MPVPFLDLKAQYASIKEEVDAAIRGVVDSQGFVLGPTVEGFEAQAASYHSVSHAIGCNSGSDAIFLALRALGLQPGDEVITVPHTYIATPEEIHRAGGRVRFVDVDAKTWNMDLDALKAAITPQTKAIVPVHIYGRPVDMTKLLEIAGDIPVVEDAAQCWGARHAGKSAGAIGKIGCFSFYPTKTLGAYGDGGMVITNDPAIAANLRALRVHGEASRYHNVMHGVNSRLDAMQAAVLGVKLKYVDGWNARRAEIAGMYRERLSGSSITLPEPSAEGDVHVWHQHVILAPRRDQLRAKLHDAGIGTMIYYPVPQHMQSCFADLGYKQGDFPRTERMSAESLALPIFPEMSEAMIDEVCDTIKAFYA